MKINYKEILKILVSALSVFLIGAVIVSDIQKSVGIISLKIHIQIRYMSWDLYSMLGVDKSNYYIYIPTLLFLGGVDVIYLFSDIYKSQAVRGLLIIRQGSMKKWYEYYFVKCSVYALIYNLIYGILICTEINLKYNEHISLDLLVVLAITLSNYILVTLWKCNMSVFLIRITARRIALFVGLIANIILISIDNFSKKISIVSLPVNVKFGTISIIINISTLIIFMCLATHGIYKREVVN